MRIGIGILGNLVNAVYRDEVGNAIVQAGIEFDGSRQLRDDDRALVIFAADNVVPVLLAHPAANYSIQLQPLAKSV